MFKTQKDKVPLDRMIIAIKKSDISPIINEIYYSPFLWIPALIILFFAFANLFEVLWVILKDLQNFVLRIFRWPKKKIRGIGTKFRHHIKKKRKNKK